MHTHATVTGVGADLLGGGALRGIPAGLFEGETHSINMYALTQGIRTYCHRATAHSYTTAQSPPYTHVHTQVCGGDALRLFQPQELELLLCGNPVLDFEALERVALVGCV